MDHKFFFEGRFLIDSIISLKIFDVAVLACILVFWEKKVEKAGLDLNVLITSWITIFLYGRDVFVAGRVCWSGKSKCLLCQCVDQPINDITVNENLLCHFWAAKLAAVDCSDFFSQSSDVNECLHFFFFNENCHTLVCDFWTNIFELWFVFSNV